MGRSLYVIPTRVEKVRLAALLFALCCFTAIAQPAFAHPLGNFTINHLVDVRQAGDTLRIRYALDMAEIPTFAVMRSRSATGKLDAAGLRSWAASEVAVVTDGLDMRADGAPLPLATRGAPLVRTRSGAGGLPTLYWVQDFVVRPGKAPALSIDDSTCIRAETCHELVSTGVCTRAQQARSYTTSTATYSNLTPAPAGVCP